MPETEIMKGTLDMLILKTLNSGPNHGYGIAQRIQVASQNVLTVEEGSLYPALFRLQRKGWIESEWGQSENNRRAKFYQLTKKGRKQLEAQSSGWDRFCAAISQVMRSV